MSEPGPLDVLQPDELLTVKEFAERQRLHVQTIYTAIRYNRLRYRVERVTAGKRAAIRIVVPRFHAEA